MRTVARGPEKVHASMLLRGHLGRDLRRVFRHAPKQQQSVEQGYEFIGGWK